MSFEYCVEMFELCKSDRNATLKSVRCPEAVLLFQMVTFLKGKVLMVIIGYVMQFSFAAHIYFGHV